LTSPVHGRIVCCTEYKEGSVAYKQVPSTQFRVTYHVLDEPVEVTVLGRVIGRYIPTPYGRYWEPAEDDDEVIPEERIRIIPAEEAK